MKNSEQYAFAMLDQNGSFTQYGLTKREYFAGLAMQALLSNPYLEQKRNGNPEINICNKAVVFADAILAELEKPKP